MKTDFIATAILPALIQAPCIFATSSGDIAPALTLPS